MAKSIYQNVCGPLLEEREWGGGGGLSLGMHQMEATGALTVCTHLYLATCTAHMTKAACGLGIA